MVADAREVNRGRDSLECRKKVAEVEVFQLEILKLSLREFRIALALDDPWPRACRCALREVLAPCLKNFRRGTELLVGEQLFDEFRARIIARRV